MKKDIYKKLETYHFAKELALDISESSPGGALPDKQRCLIFGNFGALNYGDEALLAGQLEELQTIKNVEVTVISRFPDLVKKIHKVDSISLLNIPVLIFHVITCHSIIFGGGGLFCKNTSGIRGILFQWYYLSFLLLLPIVFRKKIYVIGIGFYRNAPTPIKMVAIPLLRQVTKLTVRDQHSFDFLTEQKLPVTFCKDHSFLMSVDSKKNTEQYPFMKAYNSKKENIGIALKKPTGNVELRLKKAIKEFIIKHQKNTEFWFYSLDTHPFYPSDKTINEHIVTDMQKENPDIICHFLPENLPPKQLFSTFQLMDFFIAMRLHSMIFSYRLGIPFVGISYDKKCTSFMESIGESSVPLENVSGTALNNAYKLTH